MHKIWGLKQGSGWREGVKTRRVCGRRVIKEGRFRGGGTLLREGQQKPTFGAEDSGFWISFIWGRQKYVERSKDGYFSGELIKVPAADLLLKKTRVDQLRMLWAFKKSKEGKSLAYSRGGGGRTC